MIVRVAHIVRRDRAYLEDTVVLVIVLQATIAHGDRDRRIRGDRAEIAGTQRSAYRARDAGTRDRLELEIGFGFGARTTTLGTWRRLVVSVSWNSRVWPTWNNWCPLRPNIATSVYGLICSVGLAVSLAGFPSSSALTVTRLVYVPGASLKTVYNSSWIVGTEHRCRAARALRGFERADPGVRIAELKLAAVIRTAAGTSTTATTLCAAS